MASAKKAKGKSARGSAKGPVAEIGVIGGSGLYGMSGLTDTREIRVKTPFGDPSDAIRGWHAGREARGLFGAPRTRASPAAQRIEFSRQHLRHEIAGRGARHLRQRGGIAAGRVAPRGVSGARPVFRSHQGPRFHVFRKWAGGSRHIRQAHVRATVHGACRCLRFFRRGGASQGHLRLHGGAAILHARGGQTSIAP